MTNSVRGVTRTQQVENVEMPDSGTEEGMEWHTATNLDAPDPRPGMAQRWVRVGIRGEDDTGNFSKHLRVGWTPRSPESVGDEWAPLKLKHGSGEGKGVIRVHDMVLMEIPLKKMEARAAMLKAKNDRLAASVNDELLPAVKAGRKHGVDFFQTRKSGTSRGRVPVAKSEETDI